MTPLLNLSDRYSDRAYRAAAPASARTRFSRIDDGDRLDLDNRAVERKFGISRGGSKGFCQVNVDRVGNISENPILRMDQNGGW